MELEKLIYFSNHHNVVNNTEDRCGGNLPGLISPKTFGQISHSAEGGRLCGDAHGIGRSNWA